MKWRAISKEQAKNSPHYGINGWLLVICIMMALSRVHFLSVLNDYEGVYLAFLLISIIMSLTYPFLLLAIRHSIAPFISITFIWLGSSIDYFIVYFQNSIGSVVFMAVYTIVYPGLLTWYFISSKRVNATYRHRLPVESLEILTQAEGRINISNVFMRSSQILVHNILPFGFLSALIMWPAYAYLLFPSNDETGSATNLNLVMLYYYKIASMILSYFVAGVLVYGTIRELRGNRARFGECVAWGLRLLFPVFGIALLVSLGVILGFVLLVVPGMILMTIWWLAVPVAVIERAGIVGSIRRSAELTKGNRWKVFAIVVIVFGLGSYASRMISTLFSIPIGISDVSEISYFQLLASYIVTIFLAAWGAVVSAVGYHDLRVLKDGGNVDDIAAVFD